MRLGQAGGVEGQLESALSLWEDSPSHPLCHPQERLLDFCHFGERTQPYKFLCGSSLY